MYISLYICLVEGNTEMSQNYGNGHQVGKNDISMGGKSVFGGKIKWLSLTACMIVLLVALLALAQGAFAGTQGVHAASSKHGIKSPKHAIRLLAWVNRNLC